MTDCEARLATVILHYGRASLTRRLHGQLLAGDPGWREAVFVLDNHAPEPYPEPWLRTGENLYWAGALDLALRTLSGMGYSHVWFLNNDLYFLSGPPHLAAAWARFGRIERREGRLGVYAPSVQRSPYHPQMVRREGVQYSRVALADGIAPLISLACWRELGGIDMAGNPYGYGVDVWFSLCARRAGWAVVVDHGVEVRHVYHSTARAVSGFLGRAAEAEESYLRARIGPDFREALARRKTEVEDRDTL